jgi:hypothetical protein
VPYVAQIIPIEQERWGDSDNGVVPAICSGSMIPDTNVGGKIATINEVSDDQKATFFFS